MFAFAEYRLFRPKKSQTKISNQKTKKFQIKKRYKNFKSENKKLNITYPQNFLDKENFFWYNESMKGGHNK